jgi:tetratricopeptide (TPR) repeat protein
MLDRIARQPARSPGAGSAEPPPQAADFARTTCLAVLVLTLATLWTFAEVRNNEFVNWDDEQVLVGNDRYQGLSTEHLSWMFTTSFGGHYQPLSWLSFAVESRFWGGVSAVGFHITNVALHLVTAIGLFFVARRLLASTQRSLGPRSLVAGALAAALLFAVHPLRVESVAWATERRDVLSGAWLVLCVILYLRAVADDRPSPKRVFLALSVVCSVLSLLSKASGMTLPAILLLLDIYPLRRFSHSAKASAAWLRILAEKLWFAVPAVAIAFIAVWAQAQSGAMRTLADHPLLVRVGQAFYGIAFYLVRTVWPANLVPLYEQQPQATGLETLNLVAAAFVIAATVVLWVLRRRRTALLVAWAVYIVALSPMLGLAQSGQQVVADRYSYLACMPWALVAGAVVAGSWGSGRPRRAIRRVAVAAVLALVVGSLMLLSRAQTRIWADSYTLWSTVIDRAPDTPTAHVNLASVLSARGEYDLAREHCLKALSRLPGNLAAHRLLCRASLEVGEFLNAEEHCRIALAIASHVGKTDTGTMFDLAVALTRQRRFDEAERTYRAMIELEPVVADWHFALAGLVASRGRHDDARPILEEVLRLDPKRVEAYFRLGVILSDLGDPVAAVDTWQRGLVVDPRNVGIRARLAWVLSTCHLEELRNGPRSLRLAEGAVQDSGGRSLMAREALAAALAETGDFQAAREAIEALLAAEDVTVDTRAEARLGEQLERYRAHKPSRD